MLRKRDEKYSPELGCDPYERSLEQLFEKGYIVVDKDSGPTSHETTDNVKKILGLEKAGHSGTLDPKVTGVLLVGLNRATRLMEYMLKSDKEYVCLMYIHKEVSDEDLAKAFEKFTGTIMQLPPIVSAVKRELRPRTIYKLALLDKDKKNVLFKVRCQHGTYIRKLCSDMGEFLGVGAHMKELRRTKAGPFSEEDNMISLDRLRNLYELVKEDSSFEKHLREVVRPMEETLKEFKKVIVSDNAVHSVCHGVDLAIPGIVEIEEGIEEGEEIAMMTGRGELVAMGMAMLSTDDIVKKEKGVAVKTSKVFMEEDYYPRFDS